MKKLLTITSLLALFSIACNKQTDKPTDGSSTFTDFNFSFQKRDLDYVQIPKGTYFLYKDSASNNIDSVVVTSSQMEYNIHPAYTGTGLFDPNLPAYSYLNFSLQLKKFDGSNEEDWFYGIATTNNPKFILFGIGNLFPGLFLRERALSSNSDLQYGYYMLNSDTVFNKTHIIPKLLVEGMEYNDVLGFTSTNGIDSTKYPYRYYASSYYWAKGVGIIKRSITKAQSTQTWTLVKMG